MKLKVFFSRLKRITPDKLKNYLNWKIVHIYDLLIDKRVTGLDLTKTVPVPNVYYNKGIGMTESQPTKYLILKKVFSHIRLTESDTIIDVGCGKGRCIAYLISQRCPAQIYGIELSEEPGKIVIQWTKKYQNVHVTIGDAFSLNYNDYSVLYLSQPFFPKTFFKFVKLLEEQLKHPITFIYLFDHTSGGYLENRPGWNLQYREEFFKIHGLQVVGATRRFSIWTYTPDYTTEVNIHDLV